MKYLIILVSLLVLSSCSRQTLSNDEIIKETKKCVEAGMDSRQTVYYNDGAVYGVYCTPKSSMEEKHEI